MSYNDDRMWINRSLLYFEDKIYNTGGKLSVDVTTSTSDGKSFPAPKLYLRLRNLDGKNRNFSLDYNDVIDLIMSLIKANFKNPDLSCQQGDNNSVIKVGYNIQLKISACFATDNSQIVVLELIINDSDRGKIAIPFQTFKSLFNIFVMFKEKYWNIYTDLQNDYKFTSINNILKSLETKIQILPSLINDKKEELSGAEIQEAPLEEKVSPETIESVENYEKFVSDNVDNVSLPEIDHMSNEFDNKTPQEPVTQEIKSDLFEKTFSGNIEHFENFMRSIYHEPGWPTLKFVEGIRNSIDVDNEFSFLPNLSSSDLKALTFVSKVMFGSGLQYYFDKTENRFPSSFNILKYDSGSLVKSENVELAYDLLTILVYVHRVREKLESHTADAEKNKAILYASIRTFIDPLIFSFIADKNLQVIKNCVITRYKYYKEKGFFSYEVEVEVQEIEDFLDKMGQILPKASNIKNVEMSFPYENNYTLEQITNELIPAEIKKRLTGEDIKIDSKPKKVDHKKETVKYKSNIHRFVNEVDFVNQIPENFSGEFQDYIIKLENQDYDYTKFSIEELGDDIVKGVYLWNESDNKKEAYTSFRSKHEQCIMTKEMIITKIKEMKNVGETEEIIDPAFDFSNLNFS